MAMAFMFAVCVFARGSGESSTGGAPGRATITVEVFDRGTDGGRTNPADNKWTEWIKQKVLEDENIVVNFEPVPRFTEEQVLVNLMAAGTPPDVAMTYPITNINDWAAQGGIFDLSPYLDTTLKDLKAFLGPDPSLPGRDFIERQKDAATGAVYAIPGKRMNTARINIFMRKDWLDKLGLPVPKTTQEFYNALVAFKERDPGNVGRSNVVPFTMTQDVRWTAGGIIDAFIDPALSTRDKWINTVVDRYFLLPGYKEGVRFINKMYNDGLIDTNFPLYLDEEPMKNLVRSGMVGALCHNWDQIFRESERLYSDLLKNVPDAEWVALDCIQSSDGITNKISYDPAGVFVFIPKSSKNPDAAMRYLNWLAKFENYNFIQIGPAGIVHTMENGVPKLNPTAGDGWIQNSAQNIDYTPSMNGLFLETQEKSIAAIAAGYPFPSEMVMTAYQVAMNNAKPTPVISPSSMLTAAGPVTQTLIEKSLAFMAQSVMASPADFDRIWDAGIADWRASGAQAIINERTAKYVAP